MNKNTLSYASFHIDKTQLIKRIEPIKKVDELKLESVDYCKPELKIIGLDFKACTRPYPNFSTDLMLSDFNGLGGDDLYNRVQEIKMKNSDFMASFLYSSGKQARELNIPLDASPRVAHTEMKMSWVMGWHKRDTELSGNGGVHYACT